MPSESSFPIPRHEAGLIGAILVVLLLTAWLDAGHNYVHKPQESATNLVRTSTRLGFIALGAAVVIIAGGIDLSTGSVMAFSGTMAAIILLWLEPDAMLKNHPLSALSISLAICGSLICGFLIGSLHAWLITSVGLPPFVATLGTLVGLRSLARALCEAVTAEYLGGVSTQINVSDVRFRYLATSIWIPVALLMVISFALWLMLSRTVTGRHLYALGGNEEAARISGIDTHGLKWLAYVISAMLSSLAGVLMVCEVSVAQPETLARGYELNAIAAAVVGGCSLQGGVGTVPGTLLGAIFLRVVIDGVANVIKRGADVYEGLIVGVLVVCAVTLAKSGDLAGMPRRLFRGRLGWVTIANLTLILAAMTALIGVRLIGEKSQLEPWHWTVWSAACGFAGLLIVRAEWTIRRKRAAGAIWAIAAIGSMLIAEWAYPVVQQNSAIRFVRAAGGDVTMGQDGIIVSFRDTSLTDDQWEGFVSKLSHFPNLAEIRLQNTQITNRSLEALGRLRRKPPNLKRIDLTGTATTAAGVRQHLRDFQALKTVP
jgi:ribose/xylose/arabinose/galactoside ABC-type transport system permease subunit